MKPPKISVVVATYNLKNIVLECLKTIIHQDYPNIEIIVVDNASTDGTSAAIKKKFPKIKLIRNKKNLGVTGGANTGAKYATGSYLWCVDHDNLFKTDCLSQMYRLAKTDSKIGIVVPKIYYWEEKDIIWAAGTGVNLLTGENVFRGGKDFGQYDKVEEVQVAPANFLVKREIYDKIGLYDDTYFISYEDADFSFRVKKEGYKIIYTPKAICYHKIPLLDKDAGKRRWLSRSYWAARNKIIFMRKNSPYFWLFALLYPGWILVYTISALSYRDILALKNFFRGMLSGFSWSFINYEKDKKRKTTTTK